MSLLLAVSSGGGGGQVDVVETVEISRAEALALGLTRYFTGKECKYGHVAERYVGGRCITCAAIEKNQRQQDTAYKAKERERSKLRRQDPAVKAKQREQKKLRLQDPTVKAKTNELARLRYQRRKAAAAGEGVSA